MLWCNLFSKDKKCQVGRRLGFERRTPLCLILPTHTYTQHGCNNIPVWLRNTDWTEEWVYLVSDRFGLNQCTLFTHMTRKWTNLLRPSNKMSSTHQVPDLDLISLLTVLCALKGCATFACKEVCELLIWTDLIWAFCLWSQISPEGYKRHIFLCKIGCFWINSITSFTPLPCAWMQIIFTVSKLCKLTTSGCLFWFQTTEVIVPDHAFVF